MFFQTLEEFGGIDILVCNAAVNPIFGPILNVSFYLIYIFHIDITFLIHSIMHSGAHWFRGKVLDMLVWG